IRGEGQPVIPAANLAAQVDAIKLIRRPKEVPVEQGARRIDIRYIGAEGKEAGHKGNHTVLDQQLLIQVQGAEAGEDVHPHVRRAAPAVLTVELEAPQLRTGIDQNASGYC